MPSAAFDPRLRRLRRRPLAAVCCALVLAAAVPAGAAILPVSTCDDSGPGSLREVALGAGSGDTIDLSALTCSTITLSAGAIALSGDVTLKGPGAAALAIDAGFTSRILAHGGGTLTVADLSLLQGKYTHEGDAAGGCVVSAGNVVLDQVVISGCGVLAGEGAVARGGGLAVDGDLTLLWSTISGNTALADGIVEGGGAHAGTAQAFYSEIRGNEATSNYATSSGGGLAIVGSTVILSSAVTGNRAGEAAGLSAGSAAEDSVAILNSTVSGNEAALRIGGARIGAPLVLANSTIAFNLDTEAAGGLHLTAGADIQSTILSDNGGIDLGGAAGVAVTGANNLIRQATLSVPAGTLQADPLLLPLADNGGYTPTHALAAGSPAIDAGSNTVSLIGDQRGGAFAREVGAAADIGAFEVQVDPDALFRDGFDP
ncbi:MAG: hypothetical protein DI564_06065 [Rhodanobacter denitrificans]|uniref:Right handed beta helix domain-containing protein n=1 Tax=Rhodanobacter denitrificans TaxID=666685 RepID=A0A2W5KK22_9GAMM|nr:MAG: hypothetical protein DI564_06065 [Rhodanobacter denitrificans]